MKDMSEHYTKEEILEIFKEQHRLCSPLDPEAEPWVEISSEMTIREWRWANDLIGWKELSKFLNQEFRIDIAEKTWYDNLEPAKTKRLIEVCELISKHATKEYFQERKLLGQPCLKASVFLTLKRNLDKKGVDVSDLRPSSSFNEYLEKYFSPVLEEITLTGTKPIDKIETIRRKKGFWNRINIFDPQRHEILTGDVKTFRDVVERIVEGKELNRA